MLFIKNKKLLLKLRLNRPKDLFFAFAFLNGFFVILIILCLVYLFNQRNTLDNCGKTINQELINLSNYRNITLDIARSTNLNENFFTTSNNVANNIISEKIIKSRNTISEIKESDIVDDIHFTEDIGALTIDYENLLKENELLIDYLTQLGNEDFGLYSKLVNTLNDFKTKFGNNSIQLNSEKIEQILNSINLLKSTRNESIIKIIQSDLNLLSERLTALNSDSSNFMVIRVSDALQELNSVFQEYTHKTFEIGSYPDRGLLNKLFNSYNKIEYRLQKSLKIVYEKKTERNIKAIIILIVLILMIVVFNLFALFFYLKKEKSFKRLMSSFVDSLSLGNVFEFNKKEVSPEVKDLVQRFELFATKFINTGKSLSKLAQGNLNIDFSKENQFEMFLSSFFKMKELFENLNKQIAQEKRAQSEMVWIKSGIDKLTEVMRRDNENPLMRSNEIINMLVDYLKVPLGAIYLINEENGIKYVEMASAFAYGNEKQLYKKIMIGEGIVGTAASELKTINITNVPDYYFNIMSGFGEAKPKNIIASPIKLNKEIFGVIELASLSRFKVEEVSFIEEVCKTIAYSFAISKVYLDTLSMFENSNLEISQLKSENESLINDYEDLDSNYKFLMEKSSDNEFLVSHFNDLAIMVTLDLDGNILEVNPRFEALFRSDRKKLKHSNYKDYMADAIFTKDFDFEYFWKDIRAGAQQEFVVGIIIAGQEYWIEQCFFPVKDDLGRVKKIQAIAFDITEKINLQNQIGNNKKS